MQTSVLNEPVVPFEGKIHLGVMDSFEISRLAGELIYFGKGVVAEDDADVTLGDQPVVLPSASGDNDKFLGVAIADTTLERLRDPSDPASPAPYGAYSENGAVRVLRKGQIWVVTEDEVDDLTKGVWMRFQNAGATPPAEQLGSFRATTDADYEQITIGGVKWIAGATVGSVYYGLLEINL